MHLCCHDKNYTSLLLCPAFASTKHVAVHVTNIRINLSGGFQMLNANAALVEWYVENLQLALSSQLVRLLYARMKRLASIWL